jgi:photosystem II stability/assembly factor-like uncharacterized protein
LPSEPCQGVDAGANWINVGLGGTSFSESLAIDPKTPGTVYAAGFSKRTPVPGTGESGPYFVFKTTDGGSSWIPTGAFETPVMTLAIDPQNPKNLYAGNANGIFKTADGGGTWSTQVLPEWFIAPNEDDFPNDYVLALDPLNAGTVFAGGYHGLVKSTDGGESWSALNFGLPSGGGIVSALAIDPQDSNIVYASIFGRGIFRSADAGATWSDANFGRPLVNIHMLVIDPGIPGTIYAASNAGDGLFVLTFAP